MTQSLSLFLLTFNCAKALLDINSFSSYLFSTLSTAPSPDLVILSLQEIAPTPYAFVGGSFLSLYINRFHDVITNYTSYKDSEIEAAPYVPLVTHNIGTTCLIVYAKNASAVSNVETAGVGTGFWEMGNKGAAGVRLRYYNTEFTFAALHLTAMEWELEKRNEDWEKIVKNLIFSSPVANQIGEQIPLLSVSKNASMYKATSHLFIAGDLNYRTSNRPPAPLEYMSAFPQPDMPLHNEHHFFNLLKSDQLNQARLAGQTCHGLTEANITFPPTYKYQIEEKKTLPDTKKQAEKWNWAIHRWPSWCDRILYMDLPTWLTSKYPELQIKTHSYQSLPLLSNSDHQPVALALEVPLFQIPEPDDDEVSNDPRIRRPFEVEINSKNRRMKIRKLEILVGLALWLTTTADGGCLLAALIGLVAVGVFLKWKA